MAEPITSSNLTTAVPSGNGMFDLLMRAVKAHLDDEFKRGAIKGAEYSEVYLGALNLAMQTGMSFLLQKDKLTYELQILEKQVAMATAELSIKQQQLLAAVAEVGIAQAKLANIPKEGAQIDAQTQLLIQQKANAIVEGTVLVAQECKLRAEFDLTVSATAKSDGELTLLAQKTATEKAQILAIGVDADSVVGRQKQLYEAQTNGFARDAEQKAAKLLVDTWNVRRTTDEATVADATNLLNDATIGRAITKLLTGVGA